LSPQQVLRSLILMRVKNWDYRELRERLADGCTLRRFTDFYCQPVPKHDAFNRAFMRLTPDTLRSVNALLVRWHTIAIGRTLRNSVEVAEERVSTCIHFSPVRQHISCWNTRASQRHMAGHLSHVCWLLPAGHRKGCPRRACIGA
jgi:hypothetical protein